MFWFKKDGLGLGSGSLYKLKRIHNHCCGSGIFILDSDFLSIPNIRYWIPDFGYRIPDSGSRIQKNNNEREGWIYGIGQCWGSGSGIRDWVLFDPGIRDLGMGKKSGSGIRDKHPGSATLGIGIWNWDIISGILNKSIPDPRCRDLLDTDQDPDRLVRCMYQALDPDPDSSIIKQKKWKKLYRSQKKYQISDPQHCTQHIRKYMEKVLRIRIRIHRIHVFCFGVYCIRIH